MPPFVSDLPVVLSRSDVAWHFDGQSNFFEWQYFWAQNDTGQWLIVSAGQSLKGDFLTVAFGGGTGNPKTHYYPGKLSVDQFGNLSFDSISAKYTQSSVSGSYQVAVKSSDLDFSGKFKVKSLPLRHGDVKLSDLVTTPNYYSLPMEVSGTLSFEGRKYIFDRSPALNDHQYGITDDIPKARDWSLAFDHTWVYADLSSVRVAAASLPDAGYLILQESNGRTTKTNDAKIEVSERFQNNLPKKIRLTSQNLGVELTVEIPKGEGASTDNLFLEDGSAVVSGTINGQHFDGLGIIESGNKN